MGINALYLLGTWVALILGNYSFAYMHNKDYELAIERSYFQGIALLAAWFMLMAK